jgi:peptide methionine sulfoxide reductase msrA/msrB
MKFTVILVLLVAVWAACAMLWPRLTVAESSQAATGNASDPDLGSHPMNTEQATFAAGCFWGVESAFRHTPGVVATEVGYTGGTTFNPTYRQVCTDSTGHAESVLVTYDPTKVSYAELLDAFWTCHDPTEVDRQGPDFGTQYRSVIFYHNAEQEKLAEESMKEVNDSKVFDEPIATQVVEAGKFYSAEDYHQQYFEKMGSGATCHVGPVKVHTQLAEKAKAARLAADAAAKSAPTTQPVTQPSSGQPGSSDASHAAGYVLPDASKAACSINNASACGTAPWTELSDAELRKRLTPEQYQIARQAGTERAFTGKYWNDHRSGIYYCAVCGQPLFSSDTKFDSGTGWPSFYEAITPDAVIEKTDATYGMRRTEVLCTRCKSHLGHVFDDGPAPTGERFCMNSAVLNLVVGPTKLGEVPSTQPTTEPSAATK